MGAETGRQAANRRRGHALPPAALGGPEAPGRGGARRATGVAIVGRRRAGQDSAGPAQPSIYSSRERIPESSIT